MANKKLNALNFRGYVELKSRMETILMILNCDMEQKEKIEFIKIYIEKELKAWEKENGHLAK